MNNRQRKKWLKQHNLYVSSKETWNLDIMFAKYIIPRLKKFKELNNGYPGRDEMDTPEKWDDALDKMIQAFEYVMEWDKYWIDNQEYDYYDCIDEFDKNTELYEEIKENKRVEDDRRLAVINEGLSLFAKYYMNLWW